ncbi:MAG: hypothetical protein NC355_00430 [Blautia sp.]|nr:hypothetical protein [Blautia sp.]
MTFDTAFKHLYAEELAPYGFKKIKGRRAHFARMVGDEIVQIITYQNRPGFRPYRDFIIVWGVATVYRRKMDLQASLYNEIWMRGVRPAKDKVYFEYRDESLIRERGNAFGGNDVDMMEELRYSVEVTKETVLPQLDKIRTLRDCWEAMINSFYIDDFEINGLEEDEGMLNFILFDFEEFEAERRKVIENIDDEDRDREREIRIMNEQIELFRRYTKDEDYNRRAKEELERRKIQNQEILRSYGLEF